MKGSAARVRKCRERQREGRGVVSADVNLFGYIEVLKDAGLLKEWDENDRKAIDAATTRLLRTVIEEHLLARYGIYFSDGVLVAADPETDREFGDD